MSIQLEQARNNRLGWSDAQAVSWHSIAPSSSSVALHTPSTHNTALEFRLGHLENTRCSSPVQVQSITWWISCWRAKRNLNYLKIEVKSKSLTGLQFVLYSTSASCWKRAFLFSRNTLHTCMTELHYLALERQKLSHPKQLAEQRYNENSLEKHRLDWQIKYRNCPTTPAQLPRVISHSKT